MRRLTTMAVAFCFALTLAGLSQAGAGKTDKELLQGDWDVISKSGFGKTEKYEPGSGFLMTFKGDQMVGKSKGVPDDISGYKLDAAKNPKEIDITPDGLKFVMKGIYELKGDDLRIAIGEKDRPKNFDEKESLIVVFKKKK